MPLIGAVLHVWMNDESFINYKFLQAKWEVGAASCAGRPSAGSSVSGHKLTGNKYPEKNAICSWCIDLNDTYL